ncbi:HAD family hydrolase [Luedemannella flava]
MPTSAVRSTRRWPARWAANRARSRSCSTARGRCAPGAASPTSRACSRGWPACRASTPTPGRCGRPRGCGGGPSGTTSGCAPRPSRPCARCARGLRTGLVSDCSDELPDIFATLPVAPLFDATVYSARVGVAKPHPALYATVCARLRVDPADCLYIGDGGGCELSGATHAGMTAVQLAAPDLVEHLSFNAEPDWPGAVVTRLIDALDLVDGGEPYWADERPRARLAPVGPG